MPVSTRQGSARARGAAAVSGWLVAGCAHAPSVNVLGAYFPDWLFCIVAGVVLTVAVYRVLARLSGGGAGGGAGGRGFGPPAVVYPTLVVLLASIAWLIFFQQ
ncbi:YtcA family lipoprotein [Cupriavidus sp. 30B13]|uniref:YtcA family lipoprotein n=1 Tax=Cupriavidus sp. 30B13 TaxID=3384241 RepID=UPI003B9086BA